MDTQMKNKNKTHVDPSKDCVIEKAAVAPRSNKLDEIEEVTKKKKKSKKHKAHEKADAGEVSNMPQGQTFVENSPIEDKSDLQNKKSMLPTSDRKRKLSETPEDGDTNVYKKKKKKKKSKGVKEVDTEVEQSLSNCDGCSGSDSQNDIGNHVKHKAKKKKKSEKNIDESDKFITSNKHSTKLLHINNTGNHETEDFDFDRSVDHQISTVSEVKKHKKKHKRKVNNVSSESVNVSNQDLSKCSSVERPCYEEQVETKGKKKKKDNRNIVSQSESSHVRNCSTTTSVQKAEKEQTDRDSSNEKCKDSAENGSLEVGQWSSANLGDSERQNKFFRLLGGFKKGNDVSGIQKKFGLGKNKEDNLSVQKSGGRFAMNKTQEDNYTKRMENDYEKAMNINMNRGIGLGFEKAPDAGKKFYIDTKSSKSIKFDD